MGKRSSEGRDEGQSRRELLGAAAAMAAVTIFPGCASVSRTQRVETSIEPSCSARFCDHFVADESLGKGLGRCALGVRG